MKRKIYLAVLLNVFAFCLLINPVLAAVDPLSVPNNKFGIHILFPEELQLASNLINSNGGDWGYVTIPIQSIDKDLDKWQKFMDQAKKLHLIPILRLATFPVEDYWPKPTLYDSVDFANFLNSLSWPIKNRYVILFNEPNRAAEWGRDVDPAEYAQFASDTIDIFKERNSEFYILNGGLDMALPNSKTSMDGLSYITQMGYSKPEIFSKFDAWNSHAYPNPNFSSSPENLNKMGIRSYEHELSLLRNTFGVTDKKIFITETGRNGETLSQDQISMYFQNAFDNIWSNQNIVAVTPFLLSAGAGDFKKFSWLVNGNSPSTVYKNIQNIKKIAGLPEKNAEIAGVQFDKNIDKSNDSAQKTGIWSRVTINLLKKTLAWLIN